MNFASRNSAECSDWKNAVPVERFHQEPLSATSPAPEIGKYLKEYSVPELDLDAEMDADSVITKSTRRDGQQQTGPQIHQFPDRDCC